MHCRICIYMYTLLYTLKNIKIFLYIHAYHNIIGILYNVFTYTYIYIHLSRYNHIVFVHHILDLVSCLPNVRFGREQWIESSASWTCRFHRYQHVDASKASSSSTSGTIPDWLSTIWCSFPTVPNHIPKACKKIWSLQGCLFLQDAKKLAEDRWKEVEAKQAENARSEDWSGAIRMLLRRIANSQKLCVKVSFVAPGS